MTETVFWSWLSSAVAGRSVKRVLNSVKRVLNSIKQGLNSVKQGLNSVKLSKTGTKLSRTEVKTSQTAVQTSKTGINQPWDPETRCVLLPLGSPTTSQNRHMCMSQWSRTPSRGTVLVDIRAGLRALLDGYTGGYWGGLYRYQGVPIQHVAARRTPEAPSGAGP